MILELYKMPPQKKVQPDAPFLLFQAEMSHCWWDPVACGWLETHVEMHVNVGLKLMVHSCPHVTCGSLTMERKLLNKEEIWGDDLADSHSVVWGMWRWPLGKTRQIKTLLPCYHIMFTLLHCAQKQCCQVAFSIWNEICLRGDGWFPAWTTWFIGNVALLLTKLIALRHLWLCDCLLFKRRKLRVVPSPFHIHHAAAGPSLIPAD